MDCSNERCTGGVLSGQRISRPIFNFGDNLEIGIVFCEECEAKLVAWLGSKFIIHKNDIPIEDERVNVLSPEITP